MHLYNINMLFRQNRRWQTSKAMNTMKMYSILLPLWIYICIFQLHRRQCCNVLPQGTQSGIKHHALKFSNKTIFKLSCQFAVSLGDYHQNNYANCLISALCSASKERFLHIISRKFKAVVMLNKWPWPRRLLLNAPKRTGLEDGHVIA